MDGDARIALIGRLMPAVIHDLNNPLTTISGFAQLLAARTEDRKLRADIDQIARAAQQAGRFIAVLHRLTLQGDGVSMLDLSGAANDALTLVAYNLRGAGADVERRFAQAPVVVAAAPGLVLEAILHLLVDALDRLQALDPAASDKQVTVTTSATDGVATLAVAAGATHARPATDGASLERWSGLDRCREIAARLGGSLDDGPGSAALLGARLRLPLAGSRATVEPGSPAGAPAGSHPPQPREATSILVADDDPGLRFLLVEMLEGAGLTVETAATADEAVAAALRSRPARLLVDLRMPGGGGRAVWERLAASDPDLAARVVFVSGDSAHDGAAAFLASTGRPVVGKPFRLEDIRAALGIEP